jgi:drug/metabolite transporter (DMT)-like permease
LGLTESASNKFSQPERSHTLRGYLFIAAAGLCWGTSATLGRAVFTGRLFAGAVHLIDPLIIAQSRTTISLLVLAPLLLTRRGTQAFRMARRDVFLSFALGVLGMAASNYFYYLAIQKTNVATAIILQYTAPILVLLYMVSRGLQRATLRRVGSVLLAVLGIALTIGVIGPGQFRLNTVGLIAAEIAAISFAYYNLAASHLLERYDRWRVLVLALLAAAIFWQFVNPPWKIVAAHYSGVQWLFLLGFAIASVLLPFSLYFGGLEHLDATRAIVTSCLEPVFSIAIAAVALGEGVGMLQVLGVAVVLVATVTVQLPERVREPHAPVALGPIE